MDVFDLYAKLSLDSKEYDSALNDASEKTNSFGQKLGSMLGGVATAVGTATVAAVTAAATVVGTIVSNAVESYANYEQLVGGVETLFKSSADTVMYYAMEAYKNAGISANQYMEQVTSFSASMISSLGGDTAKAAELSNQAIIDMADNSNKMGTSMEAIQNAYQGFAKQNYTMLDNLKLGYGGTKEEMNRLVEDAEKLDSSFKATRDSNGDLAYSFADVTKAIHIVQTEMGITGTTAEEAEQTISGSLNMLKASWQDLITSVAGGGKDMSEAINAVVSSAETFATNLIPVIEQALYGIGDLVRGLAPVVGDALPELLTTLTPMLLDAVMSIVDALIQALPNMVQSISTALQGLIPSLVAVFFGLLSTLLSDVLPEIIQTGITLVLELGRGIAENMGQLIDTLVGLVNFLIDVIVENLPEIIQVGLEIILALATGLVDNLPQIMGAVAKLISGIISEVMVNLGLFLELGLQIILKVAEGILLAIPLLVGKFMIALNLLPEGAKVATDDTKKEFNSLTNEISNATDTLGKHLKTSSDNFDDFSKDVNSSLNSANKYSSKSIESISETTSKLATASKTTKIEFNNNFLDMQTFAAAVAGNIANSMSDMADSVWSAASQIASACNSIKSSLNSLSGLSVPTIGTRASGGYITAGSTYLVGEMGPELITASKTMYVHNAEETAGMLGGRNIVINVNGDVYDDQRSMTRKLKNAMLNVLSEQMAYG